VSDFCRQRINAGTIIQRSIGAIASRLARCRRASRGAFFCRLPWRGRHLAPEGSVPSRGSRELSLVERALGAFVARVSKEGDSRHFLRRIDHGMTVMPEMPTRPVLLEADGVHGCGTPSMCGAGGPALRRWCRACERELYFDPRSVVESSRSRNRAIRRHPRSACSRLRPFSAHRLPRRRWRCGSCEPNTACAVN